MKLNWKVVIPLGVWAVLAIYGFAFGAPTGLTIQSAWLFFALFVAVILGLILEPIPAAAIGLMGVTVAATMLYVNASASASITWELSGFQDTTVW